MTRSAIVPAILALCAAGSAAALDHELASAPFVIGASGSVPEYYVGIEGGLESKVMDDYRVVADDSGVALDGRFRAYGLGLTLKTDWAAGQSPDVSRPGSRNNPGELLRTEIRADWALEIRDPRDANVPLLQIIPHFTYVSYPNQAPIYVPGNENFLKERQRWLGADVWYALPIEGVELGGGVEQNVSNQWRAFRGGLGAREFVQYNSVDMSFWQLYNFGDSEYRYAVAGKDKSGSTTAVIGGRATVPMFTEDLFGFVEVEASYWLDKQIRENFKDSGQDSGDVVTSVGLTWIPK